MLRKRKIIVLIVIFFTVFIAKGIIYNISYPVIYKEYIMKYSEEYNIDPYLLTAIINAESKFDKDAKSHKGAIGLMQLTGPTAEWVAESMGDENFKMEYLYKPEQNIKMGAWYIDNIREEFDSTELVLAAYNAGRGNVQKWINSSVISADGKDYSNIPYAETEKYIKKVLINQKIYQILYDLS